MCDTLDLTWQEKTILNNASGLLEECLDNYKHGHSIDVWVEDNKILIKETISELNEIIEGTL